MQTVSHGTSSYQEKADGAILATGQKKSFFNKSLMNSNYISQFVDRWAGWQKALNVQIEPRRKIKGYACWVRGTMTGEWGDILFPWMLSSCCLILCAKCFFFFFLLTQLQTRSSQSGNLYIQDILPCLSGNLLLYWKGRQLFQFYLSSAAQDFDRWQVVCPSILFKDLGSWSGH